MATMKAEMSFLEHLGVLRGHLIRSVIAVLAFTIFAFLNKSYLFDELLLASKEPDFVTYRTLCRISEWFNLGDVLLHNRAAFYFDECRHVGAVYHASLGRFYCRGHSCISIYYLGIVAFYQTGIACQRIQLYFWGRIYGFFFVFDWSLFWVLHDRSLIGEFPGYLSG